MFHQENARLFKHPGMGTALSSFAWGDTLVNFL